MSEEKELREFKEWVASEYCATLRIINLKDGNCTIASGLPYMENGPKCSFGKFDFYPVEGRKDRFKAAAVMVLDHAIEKTSKWCDELRQQIKSGG